MFILRTASLLKETEVNIWDRREGLGNTTSFSVHWNQVEIKVQAKYQVVGHGSMQLITVISSCELSSLLQSNIPAAR
jgi:hypothetical protein